MPSLEKVQDKFPLLRRLRRNSSNNENLEEKIYYDRKSYCVPLLLSPVDKIKDNERDDIVQRRLSIAAPEREFVISRNEEETWAELFYDLFFVANLAAFTDYFDVKDSASLRSYISFFSILWTTWLQVSIFDARFAKDSIFERVCRGLQLAVMIGFSSIGLQLHLNEVATNTSSFTMTSMFLFVSRITLAVQYFVVYLYISSAKSNASIKAIGKEYAAFIGMFASNLITAGVYLGLYFAFPTGKNTVAWVGWHIVAVFETITMFALSTMGKNVSLKNTHLVHRMGLLTLIMLGEGVLRGTSNVSVILEVNEWTRATTVTTLCAIATGYFLWMLCFDGYPRERWSFGALKHLVWISLQFPLHLWIVLFVSSSQWIATLNNANELWTALMAAYNENFAIAYQAAIDASGSANNVVVVFTDAINRTISTLPYYSMHPDIRYSTKLAADDFLTILLQPPGNSSPAEINFYYDLYGNEFSAVILLQIFQNYRIISQSDYSSAVAYNKVIMILKYSLISLGAIFLCLALHRALIMHRRDKVAYLQIGYRVVFGLGLILAAVLTTMNQWAGLFNGPWIAPILLLTVLGLVLVDKITVHIATYLYDKKHRGAIQRKQKRRQDLTASQLIREVFQAPHSETDVQNSRPQDAGKAPSSQGGRDLQGAATPSARNEAGPSTPA